MFSTLKSTFPADSNTASILANLYAAMAIICMNIEIYHTKSWLLSKIWATFPDKFRVTTWSVTWSTSSVLYKTCWISRVQIVIWMQQSWHAHIPHSWKNETHYSICFTHGFCEVEGVFKTQLLETTFVCFPAVLSENSPDLVPKSIILKIFCRQNHEGGVSPRRLCDPCLGELKFTIHSPPLGRKKNSLKSQNQKCCESF